VRSEVSRLLQLKLDLECNSPNQLGLGVSELNLPPRVDLVRLHRPLVLDSLLLRPPHSVNQRKLPALDLEGNALSLNIPMETTSSFGQPAQTAATSGFGGFGAAQAAPAQGGMFGAKSAPATGMFGAATPSTGMFGAKTTPAFGAAASTPATSGFGGFGASNTQQPATGMFGAPQQQAQPTGGMFGQAAAQTTGFGQPAKPAGLIADTLII
jgi:hypothetical protein